MPSLTTRDGPAVGAAAAAAAAAGGLPQQGCHLQVQISVGSARVAAASAPHNNTALQLSQGARPAPATVRAAAASTTAAVRNGALARAALICRSGHGGSVMLDGCTYSASGGADQEALKEQCLVRWLTALDG